MLRLICFLILVSVAGIASSSNLVNISTSSYSGKIRMVAPSGVVVEFDRLTDRVYVAGTNGSVADYSIQDVINSKSSIASERVRLRSAVNDLMTKPKYTFNVDGPRVATNDSHWPRAPVSWCGDVICLIEPSSIAVPDNSVMSGIGIMGESSSCNHYLCPQFPCINGPCVPHPLGGKYLYSSLQAGWGIDQGGGTIRQQEEVVTRRQLHREQSQEACSDMVWKGTAVVGASALAVTGCATAPAHGGLGCAGGVLILAVAAKDYVDTVDRCYSDYVPLT